MIQETTKKDSKNTKNIKKKLQEWYKKKPKTDSTNIKNTQKNTTKWPTKP